jgi:hypothetical protein
MTRLPMSSAAAALLRALLARAPLHRDRILLTDYRSTDWQSLTFVGERHEMRFRIPGPDAKDAYDAVAGNIAEDDFSFPRQILADIAVFGTPTEERDGSICFCIEALTIEE